MRVLFQIQALSLATTLLLSTKLSPVFSLISVQACAKAMRTMKFWCTNPALPLAVHRRTLVRRIGILTSRGWAQHTIDRWRDAVTNRPKASQTTEIDLAADNFFLTTRIVAAITACTCLALKAPGIR